MDLNEFKRRVEIPIEKSNERGYDTAFVKYVISYVMRMTLSNIDEAKEYYDKLPKAICD